MTKITKLAAAVTLLVLAFSAPVFAASSGQLGGGDNYIAKNITKGGSYGNSTTATCNDLVQYSMQLTNTQFGALNNVTLKVSLPSNGGVSTATATTALGGTTGTTDTATVTLTSGATQSLVSGSTELFDSSAHRLRTLPDTIAGSGVNIGTLNGSTTEYVLFKVKVNCSTPTPAKIKVCELATKKIVTIKESQFDSSKYTKDLSKCQKTPVTPTTPVSTLPETGAGEMLGIVAATIVASTIAARVFLGRRFSRQ